MLPFFLFPVSSQGNTLSWLFKQALFHLGDKKGVAGHVRQVVVLHSNDCMGICLGGLSIGRLRQVVIL